MERKARRQSHHGTMWNKPRRVLVDGCTSTVVHNLPQTSPITCTPEKTAYRYCCRTEHASSATTSRVAGFQGQRNRKFAWWVINSRLQSLGFSKHPPTCHSGRLHIYLVCGCTKCTFYSHGHAFLFRPRAFSRALGCGARTGPACALRRKLGPGRAPWRALWAFSVAASWLFSRDRFRRARANQAHGNT